MLKQRKCCPRLQYTEVILERMNLIDRELTSSIEGVTIRIYVPPNCVIVLRGERIKLRMLEAGDLLRVRYAEARTYWIAREIEVQSTHVGRLPA